MVENTWEADAFILVTTRWPATLQYTAEYCTVMLCTAQCTVQWREMKQTTLNSSRVQCTEVYCSGEQCTIQCCAVQ